MESNINLTYIKEMVGEDTEMVRDFIADIISQLLETGELMKQYVVEGNLNELATVAHKLKSSIQIVGANKLHEKLYALELASKQSTEVSEIITQYHEVEALRKECLINLESV